MFGLGLGIGLGLDVNHRFAVHGARDAIKSDPDGAGSRLVPKANRAGSRPQGWLVPSRDPGRLLGSARPQGLPGPDPKVS